MSAADEPLATVEDLVALAAAPQIRRHRRNRARLSLHRRQRGDAAGKPAHPYRGRAPDRPAADHPRPRRRRRHGPHPDRGAPRGRLYLRHALLSSGAALAEAALDLGFYLSMSGIAAFPKSPGRCATSSRPPRWTASWWKPTAPTLRRRPIAASATNRPIPPIPRESGPRSSAWTTPTSPRRPQANFDRLFCKAAQPTRPPPDGRAALHHPWLRLVRRRAAAGRALGRLRPGEPAKPPPPLFAAGRAREPTSGTTRVLIDTSPDLRAQLLDAGVGRAGRGGLHPCPCRPCARHRRPADDRLQHASDACRSGPMAPRRTAFSPLRLCLRPARGLALSADPRPAHDRRRRDDRRRRRRDHAARRSRSDHGSIDALGFRIGDVAYLPDVADIPEAAWPALEGLDCWILDALRRTPHPTTRIWHDSLEWIARAAPRRAVLTNMHIDLDYATVRPRPRTMSRRPMTAWSSLMTSRPWPQVLLATYLPAEASAASTSTKARPCSALLESSCRSFW